MGYIAPDRCYISITMNYRLSCYSDTGAIANEFGVAEVEEEPARGFNLALGHSLASIVEDDGGRVLQVHRWGLEQQAQSGDSQDTATTRAEKLLEVPWRNMLRNGRSIVVVDNFFLFADVDGVTTPFLCRRQDGAMMGLAALWEAYEREDETTGRRCVLVATKSNPIVGRIHRRSPAILLEPDYGKWLSNETDELELVSLLKPYPGELLCYPVTKRMIDAKFDSSEILKPMWS